MLIYANKCKKDEYPSAITDADGNVYTSVTIGTQVWMKENLNTTKLNDGISLQNVTDNSDWYASPTSAYCWINNDAATFKNTFGAFYNWYAVATGKFCPSGWHVLSDAEQIVLKDYLIFNGYNYAGTTKDNKIVMALGSATGWKSSGTYCYPGSIGGPDFQEKRNASGFTALPAGFRFYHGEFVDRGTQASWWTSTEYLTTQAFVWVLSYNEEDTIQIGSFGNYGHSVRCLKD